MRYRFDWVAAGVITLAGVAMGLGQPWLGVWLLSMVAYELWAQRRRR